MTRSRWLSAAAILLLLLYWLLNALLLPSIVRWAFDSTLRTLGIGSASFHVDRASLWAADLSDIQGNGIQVPRLSVKYSPLEVLFGQLDTVQLIGVQVSLDLGKGAAQNGIRLPGSSGRPGGAPHDQNTAPKALPVRRLEIVSCMLLIEQGASSLAIPIDGRITPAGRGGSNIECTIRLLNTSVKVHGQIDTAQNDADLQAEVANLDIASIMAFIPPIQFTESFHAGGRASLSARYRMSGGSQATTVSLRAADGWIAARAANHVLVARGVDGRLSASLDDHWKPSRVDARLAAVSAAVDQDIAAKVSCVVHDAAPGTLAFETEVSAPGYSAKIADGRVAGWLGEGADLTVSTSCRVAGRLPRAAADALLARGVDATQLGAASLEAIGTASFPRAAAASRPATAPDWKAQLAARLTLQRGNIWLPSAGISLVDFGASADLEISANSSGIAAKVRHGATLFARAIVTSWVDDRELLADDRKADLVDFTLMGGDAAFTLPLGHDSAGWGVEVPALRMRLAPVSTRLHGASLQGLAGIVQVDSRLDRTGGQVLVDPQSWVGESGVTAGAGSQVVQASAAWINFKPQNNEPASSLSFGGGNIEAKFSLSSQTDPALRVVYGGNEADLRDVRVGGSVTKRGSAAPVVLAGLEFDRSSIAISAPPVSIPDLAAKIPIVLNGQKPTAGAFSSGSVRIGAEALPGLRGAIGYAGGHADFSLTWPLMPQVSINVQASADLLGTDGPRAQVHAWIPSFTLARGDEIASRFAAAGGTFVTGDFSADAKLGLDRGRLSPKVVLNTSHVNFKSKQYAADIRDISTSVTFDSFSPLSTPGDQRLTVGAGSVGKLQVTQGEVGFRVESLHSILIEQTGWGWAGGKLYSHALRIDPFNPTFDFIAYADDISTNELLKLVTGPGSAGEGTFYGRLPVKVKWPSVQFGAGFLYAAPGAGVVKLSGPAADQFGNLLQKDPRLGDSGNSAFVRNRIVAALRDFHYNILRVDFTKQDENLLAAIKLRGSGTIGRDTQELGLDININGFDQLLRNVLVIKGILGK